jgi:isoleucyl-tRNA synthetase
MSEEIKKVEKSVIAQKEEAILEFWQKNNIFKKSLEKDAPKGNFVFYDGPPFATGLPHYGHMLPGTIKDVIPRYKTMQGYRVPRRWGWDTHGLPVENLIEKELGLKNKKDIEDLGIERFNEAARASVLRYDVDWKQIIPRSGRWVDLDHAYLTMQSSYSESIWWSFKTLFDKNLIYQGYKVMYLCPHCGTTLSNFEVAQGYKEITDISIYVKFELVDEPGTFVLAWTTTPWTLPGNVALAVGSDIEYSKVKMEGGLFILGSERISHVLKDKSYEVVGKMKGKDLIGKSYKPVFDYYKDLQKSWNIYGAEFVTVTDGTGVVHIAPAYGEDDYNLAQKEKLPVIHHVGSDGLFKKEVTDLVGQSAKPKEDSQQGDVKIIKLLAAKGTLFAKEKIIHSYPHCWRCDTPLLNYATSSWFVKVTDFKDKLVEENKKVSWTPEEVGEGRFGKWLENARDWAISRSRYWGATLPVWMNADGTEKLVMGSIADLKARTKRNTYFVMRHGEADNNVDNILVSEPDPTHHLTDIGRDQALKTAETLKDKKIDLIISSDLNRTRQTTEIIKKVLGLSDDAVMFDERLREYNFGVFNGKGVSEWHDYWSKQDWGEVSKKVPNGESPLDVFQRVGGFLEDVDTKYKGKTILIVSHNDPIRFMLSYAEGNDIARIDRETWRQGQFKNAEVQTLDYAPIPRNNDHILDLHRPYIDSIVFKNAKGEDMKRVPEVFDTWYESGSMPYASVHYPFENKEKIDSHEIFPADFIAEGQDQTRGWYYSLLVLSTGLFGIAPYKKVVVNGTVLAEDGQKMSKRLKNYPELMEVFNKYGADAARYYLMASPAVRSEDIHFSEKGVDEIVKKIVAKLDNVYTFYKTYEQDVPYTDSKNILDQWIIARLNQINSEVTTALEKYEIDKAARPFMNFIDDLSTWYLRRSRDRFKGDDVEDRNNALATTRYVLRETSKLIAPFMPFMAEDIYQKVKPLDSARGRESVHLEAWPQSQPVNNEVIENMDRTRAIVSLGLEARAKSGIKVRQPLASASTLIGNAYVDLIRDELNVKEVFDSKEENNVTLDTVITPELKLEGQARELIRNLQDMRKKAGLSPSDFISINIFASEEGKNVVESFKTEISKTAQVNSIDYIDNNGGEIKIDDLTFKIEIVKK